MATCGPVTKQWPTAMVEILMMRQAGVPRQSRRVRAPRTLGDAKPRWTPHTIGERDTLVCPRRLGHPEVQPARLHTEFETARGSRSETSSPPLILGSNFSILGMGFWCPPHHGSRIGPSMRW